METPTLSLPTSGVLSVWEALWEVESLQQQSGFKAAPGNFTHCLFQMAVRGKHLMSSLI